MKNFNKFAESTTKRSAFTMLELVFVIAIVGLVSVAGGKAIVQILTNYTLQKEFARIELDSASAIRQISSYLQNSIWDSIAIQGNNNYTSMPFVNNAEQGKIGIEHGTRLYFIEKNKNIEQGYFDGNRRLNLPLFSGFVDVEKSGCKMNNGKIEGCNIIYSQSSTDNMRSFINSDKIALYFPFVNVGTNSYVGNKYYAQKVTDNTAIFPIRGFSYNNKDKQEVMELFSVPKQIGDVAIIVNQLPSFITIENGANQNYEKGDLTITQSVQTTKTTLIAKRVSNLHIWTEASSSLIRIRICFEPSVVKSVMDEFCKEGIIMQ
ncbi:type II secretion system protein [Helicobacter sp. 23-1044]